MNVSILNSYNPYKAKAEINIDKNNVNQSNDRNSNDLLGEIVKSQSNLVSAQNTDLLSQQERAYFVKLFPQNQDLIQNHIVFDRNGRLNNSNVSKGMLLDSKA